VLTCLLSRQRFPDSDSRVRIGVASRDDSSDAIGPRTPCVRRDRFCSHSSIYRNARTDRGDTRVQSAASADLSRSARPTHLLLKAPFLFHSISFLRDLIVFLCFVCFLSSSLLVRPLLRDRRTSHTAAARAPVGLSTGRCARGSECHRRGSGYNLTWLNRTVRAGAQENLLFDHSVPPEHRGPIGGRTHSRGRFCGRTYMYMYMYTVHVNSKCYSVLCTAEHEIECKGKQETEVRIQHHNVEGGLRCGYRRCSE